MSKRVRRDEFDDEHRSTYLAALEKTGEKAHARKVSGNVSKDQVFTARKNDPEFDAAEEEAIERYAAGCGMEIHRRGITGIEESVWHEGTLLGTVTRYDSKLLVLQAKRFQPDYRERIKVDQTITQKKSIVSSMADELAELTEEQQELLHKLLELQAEKETTEDV